MRKDIFIILIAAATLISVASYFVAYNEGQSLQKQRDIFADQSCSTVSKKTGSTSTLFYLQNKCSVPVRFTLTFLNSYGYSYQLQYCLEENTVTSLEQSNDSTYSSTQYDYDVVC
ncbi:transmembrane protein, putative (macronuclear) [Tetrahymena thermophila SB210]|uniref:Transmembrane protein, putative n=1 Tax=Tetrahymena thermophila (strain SB210) TaxID=312017 RepID=I7M7U1_TETTS|nr:transmembrane protein, putative [Tetrahymena thermophila SB210]EAR96000.1 transmembrane protein, putative [Tetrahymena thermophila SB210]|eukprot:XP_001016245.1 transmembrane protein, putative [Tetrahymena thermophila SB210]